MTQEKQFGDDQNFAKGEFEGFLPSEDSDVPTPKQSFAKLLPTREPIKHLLIGSPKAVTGTIHYLQVIGYANVGDWSQLLPTGNPDEVMSILIRQIVVS
ncbi:hypothetical protein I8748_02580 [Nostoc sp. CENA67]|uniref:Uncharacterized protein n=1 Tax=Amazonocrinis nigriterrae CENA67 TaxID=2794033 RepID=A0A8J7L7J4_9NOST|nr:hypothetical protein [Amazonocrinis nigriterrae]MBH8561076.1 hypothetical protein [Amazonocrinis nigriterrae CENA67]